MKREKKSPILILALCVLLAFCFGYLQPNRDGLYSLTPNLVVQTFERVDGEDPGAMEPPGHSKEIASILVEYGTSHGTVFRDFVRFWFQSLSVSQPKSLILRC